MNNNLLNGIITEVHKSHYIIYYDNIYLKAKVSGRYSFMVTEESEYPVVGDTVHFRMADESLAIIERTKTRKSYISRISRSNTNHEELLAANIDMALICVSLNNDFNVRKIERLLSLVSHPKIKPILVLTKKDLVSDLSPYLNQILHIDLEMIIVSTFDPKDIALVREKIGHKTVVCIGASGVGKSTLINQLIGRKHFATSDIRESDAQGHHTTTHRELIVLEGGGAIIDTPGIRVITRYLMEDIESRFKSISTFSKQCKFRDCTHTHEPGCAVLNAIDNGEISYYDYEEYKRLERYNSFLKNRVKSKSKKH